MIEKAEVLWWQGVMVTLPEMFREDPSQVSAHSCSSLKVRAFLFSFFHSSTTSFLINERPAPVSIRMGTLLGVRANSKQSHALFHVICIFATCRGFVICWAVLHEHITIGLE